MFFFRKSYPLASILFGRLSKIYKELEMSCDPKSQIEDASFLIGPKLLLSIDIYRIFPNSFFNNFLNVIYINVIIIYIT